MNLAAIRSGYISVETKPFYNVSAIWQSGESAVMYKAGIYCRLSLGERDKESERGSSIHSQILMAEDYIAGQKNVEKVKVYADDGASGSNINRMEFRRMLADMELGVINMVILKDVSRLGREHIDTNYYLEKYFPEKKIRVVSILDHYDSDISAYDELLEIKTLLNDMYLRDTSKKIRTAIQAKRTMGEYTPKEPPFGYVKSKTVHNHLEVDRWAAGIVRRIYSMYLNGSGGTVISRTLNEEQLPCPAQYKKEVLKSGYAWPVGKGLWTPSTVRGILNNPVYTGAVVVRKFNKPSYKLKDRKKIPIEELELIENAHEAIISKEDFARVQQIRKEHRVPYFDKNKKPHKYAGLLFCGKCKTVMRKRYLASHNGYDGYECGFHQKMGQHYCELNFISFEKLDELVIFALNQQISQKKKDLKELERQIKKKGPETENEITRLTAKAERTVQYRKKAYEQYMDEVLSQKEYLELRQMYDRERKQYQRKLRELEDKENSEREKLRNAASWLSHFCRGGITEKELTREMLQELIEKIYVYPDHQIEIYFRFRKSDSPGEEVI